MEMEDKLEKCLNWSESESVVLPGTVDALTPSAPGEGEVEDDTLVWWAWPTETETKSREYTLWSEIFQNNWTTQTDLNDFTN